MLCCCRRALLQGQALSVTSVTSTSDPATAQKNINAAIADGSLPTALKQLGLNYVPGSISTANVSPACCSSIMGCPTSHQQYLSAAGLALPSGCAASSCQIPG